MSKDYRLEVLRQGSSIVKFTITNKLAEDAGWKERARYVLLLVVLKIAAALVLGLVISDYMGLTDFSLKQRLVSRPYLVVIVPFICILVLLRRFHEEEHLLVIQGVGLQTYSSSSYYFCSATRLIPSKDIIDIILHEGFKGMKVVFYLGVLTRDPGSIVVIFPKSLPRRPQLEKVWRGARRCLFHDQPEKLAIHNITAQKYSPYFSLTSH